MRFKGKLLQWYDDKAFGFIKPNSGGEDVFIHKTAFSNRQRIPKINDVITFSITKDNQGRYCADKATYSGEKLIKRQAKGVSKFSVYLSVSFLGLLILAVITNHMPGNLLIAYLVLSSVTFIVYALDKSKAQRGAWRTAESSLHLLALVGGWPGAAIAQQILRHKSKKRDFRIMFWFTVIINCTALIWLMSAQGAQLLLMLK